MRKCVESVENGRCQLFLRVLERNMCFFFFFFSPTTTILLITSNSKPRTYFYGIERQKTGKILIQRFSRAL